MYSRVYVEITNICNMSCSFCHGHSRAPRQMSREEFAVVLRKVRGLCRYIYFHLMGEPLLHPDLPLFIEQAAEQGLLPVITTNGTLVQKRKNELIASGVHKVSISLHSFEGTDKSAHEKYLAEVTDFAEEASASGIIVVLRLWNSGADDKLNGAVLDFLRSRIDGEWTPNTKGIRIHD
ncbi:MAG: radical SAM protein, partial [Clostridia bacterium]|nr:radical SAM protein [Clostridia bacterium]